MSRSNSWSSQPGATAPRADLLHRILARLIRARALPPSAWLGIRGEKLARKHLRRRRYKVLARNLRTPAGEADIVALAPDRKTLVIVEVKTRALSAGLPSHGERAITRDKKQRLIRVARTVARQRRWLDRPLRIDIIAIDQPAQGKATLRHHERAVTLNDR